MKSSCYLLFIICRAVFKIRKRKSSMGSRLILDGGRLGGVQPQMPHEKGHQNGILTSSSRCLCHYYSCSGKNWGLADHAVIAAAVGDLESLGQVRSCPC